MDSSILRMISLLLHALQRPLGWGSPGSGIAWTNRSVSCTDTGDRQQSEACLYLEPSNGLSAFIRTACLLQSWTSQHICGLCKRERVGNSDPDFSGVSKTCMLTLLSDTGFWALNITHPINGLQFNVHARSWSSSQNSICEEKTTDEPAQGSSPA